MNAHHCKLFPSWVALFLLMAAPTSSEASVTVTTGPNAGISNPNGVIVTTGPNAGISNPHGGSVSTGSNGGSVSSNPGPSPGGPNNSSPSTDNNDPVTQYMNQFDTNHDGRLDKDELSKMSAVNPKVYQQAKVFADPKTGELGVAQINAWRNYLRATVSSMIPPVTITRSPDL